jgi:hypothetical protein
VHGYTAMAGSMSMAGRQCRVRLCHAGFLHCCPSGIVHAVAQVADGSMQ